MRAATGSARTAGSAIGAAGRRALLWAVVGRGGVLGERDRRSGRERQDCRHDQHFG